VVSAMARYLLVLAAMRVVMIYKCICYADDDDGDDDDNEDEE
jgi:hypothetical protein